MTSNDSTEPRPLISTTSILILSSFLIGMTVSRVIGDELTPYVLACGVAGFVAYVVFTIANYKRMEATLEREKRSMETRLEKHLRSLGGPEANPPAVSGTESEEPSPRTVQPDNRDEGQLLSTL